MELELHLLFRSPGGGGVMCPRGGGGGGGGSCAGVISILSSCYSISNCDHLYKLTVHFTVCPIIMHYSI